MRGGAPGSPAPGVALRTTLALYAGEDAPLPRPEPLAVCGACRQPVHHNRKLGISFCAIHEFSAPVVLIPTSQKRLRGA